MKILTSTCLLLFLSIFGYSQTLNEMREQKRGRITSSSPCNDSLYQALKKVPLESMTEREYQYFLQKDMACSEFQKIGEAQVSSMNLVENERRAMNVTWILCGLALVFVIIAYTAN